MSGGQRPEISFVIPAFNEAGRLPRALRELLAFLSTQPWSFELVLSDDGSTDGTAACFERAAAGAQARVVRSERNRGKGHAVRQGMLAARGSVLVMCDADGSMPAGELPKLIEPVRSGAAPVAIGSRYANGGRAAGQPAWRRAWSRLTRAVVKRKLVAGIDDTQCGYKAFSAPAARGIFGLATIPGWAFDLEVLGLARHLGYRVLEVPVEWADGGGSRMRALSGLRQVVSETLRIRSNFRRGLYGPAGVFRCGGRSPMQT